MIKLANDNRMVAPNAVQKLVNSNALPIILSTSKSVIALTTKINEPSERMVKGSVNKINIGLTNTFNIDKIALAPMAAPNPSIVNEFPINPAIAKNKIALTNILTTHLTSKHP